MPLTEGDRFTSGDFAPVGRVTYGCIFFNTLWMLEAVMQAINLMTESENWNTVGTLSPEDCASLAVEMVEDFNPVVNTTGMIIPYGGGSLPDGALWCDGASYLRSAYPALFAVIDTAFGADDDDHFDVPDLRTRVPYGADEIETHIGDTFGEAQHYLTITEMPAHFHEVIGALVTLGISPGEAPLLGYDVLMPYGDTSTVGGGGSHNNIQPSIAVSYIILTR